MKKLLLFVAALCCAVMVNAQATYQITISPAEGESFNLSVAPIDNIASIKSQIQDLKSIPTNQQVLIFAGKVLKDAKCVADYNIQAGSTVYLRFVAHNEQGALGGKFSVADNKKIAFSQGNLQATTEDLGENWTWSFATEQYDLIGNAFANTAINGNGTVSTNGTVDLFGWSTSATYYGIHNSTAGNTYIGDFADWGANPISNGGNLANQWRTLTKDEWGYLFNTRTTTSGIRYARATVNNVTGIILLPDDWSTTYYELSNTNTEDAAYASNTITLYDWITTLEVQGAVFLPATGQRNGTSVGYVGTVSGYWSATQGGSTYAFHLDFGSGFTVPTGIDTRSMGYSVRLVKDLLDVTVTSAPEAIANLYYNGTAQELVTAGIADGGEMQYKVGDGEWSAYLPMATEPGEYAVYYRVAGDADHVNSPVYGPIDVSILSTVAYVTTSTSVSTYYADLASALSAWEANSTLTLLADATISSRIDIDNTRTLDLNGYGIKMTGTDCIFLVQSGGDLTMIDSNPTRSTRTYNVSDHLATLADGGAYSFQGGYLTGGQGSTAEDSYRRGGAVLLMGTNCRFTMRGGTILGNCAGFGGGVHVRRGKFVMEGGAIIYNSVSQYNYHGGGAVFVDCGYGADLTLGGTALIEHNYANGYENGQVFIGEGADGQLVISGGSPRVINSANTNNLILGINSTNYSIMTITGELTADADLSLYVYRTGVLTSGYDTYHHGVDPNTFFSVQNSEYRLKLNASGEVQAVTMATIASVPSANSGLIYNGSAQELITAGSSSGGEMQYSLDNSNWSADIPTATEAGEYTVYYRVIGDANHGDNPGASVAVSIAKEPYRRVIRIAKGTYATFAQGNLQYQASTGTWRFAENQYDEIGNDNNNISLSNTGWIDMYGYGTGDNPTQTANYNSAYSTFTDWGANPISNGGNVANAWRTPTNDEWGYVFFERNNAATMFGLGTVNDIPGVFILPENWELPTDVSFTPNTTIDLVDRGGYFEDTNKDLYAHNTYTLDQWKAMDAAGVVFLPAAGNRAGSNTYNVHSCGNYWSSSTASGQNVHYVDFYTNGSSAAYLKPQTSDNRYSGRTVRLLQEFATAPTAKSLTYTGSAQKLVNAGTTSSGIMQYSLDNTNWSADIPTATNADTYTVYYKIEGDVNHIDFIPSANVIEVSIAKADASVSAAPTAIDDLVYNGSAQALVNAGTPSGGELQYSLDNVNWSADIPTATEGGIYTVYYKVVGDANHNDVTAASLNVTIKNTITWLDGDGNTLKTDVLAYGETPEYTGATPTKTATAEYTYTFNDSWSPAIAAVTADAAYTATFDSVRNSYTITWLMDDDTEIDHADVEYGVVPTHADPSKDATAQYTYTFTGWTPEVVAVTGAATYTATFSSTVNKYTITFEDEDGTTLSAEEWEYGAMPTCAEPTKAEDENYTYAFKAWTPDIATVTSEATYTATYEATEKPQIPTGLDDTVSDSTAIKRLVNGQLLIEKNGRIFNAQGIEVK